VSFPSQRAISSQAKKFNIIRTCDECTYITYIPFNQHIVAGSAGNVILEIICNMKNV
jgi:hypothetical protein